MATSLADRLAGRQQGRARPPLRRVGGERAHARVRRRRRGDGAGRARPRPLDLSGAARRSASEREEDGLSRAAGRWRCSTTSCPTGRRSSPPTSSSTACSPRSSPPAPTARVEPMAQRARKILQEEGSHRVHAEAWARRLCGGGERDALLARLEETWDEAGRWPGPPTTPATAQRSRPDGERDARRAARAGADVAGRAAGARASIARRAERLVGLGRGGAPMWAPVDLPVLRRAGARARRPVGRADHHAPVALQRLRLLLRGGARGLRGAGELLGSAARRRSARRSPPAGSTASMVPTP